MAFFARQHSTGPVASEHAHVTHAQNGDHAALVALIAAHEQPLYNFVLSLVRNPDDARDLTQEVWLRVATRLPDLREPDRFTPWLYRIARNRCLDFLRLRKSDLVASGLDAMSGGDEDGFDPPDAGGVVPEQHVLSLDERRKVWETLGALSDADRTALFLREQLDLPYAEIAEVLEITRNAAQVRVFRARERFRRHYTRVEAETHDCEVAVLQLSAYVDGELGLRAAAAMTQHLDQCLPCETRAASMREGRRLYQDLGMVSAPPGLLAAVLAQAQLAAGGAASITAGELAAGGTGSGFFGLALGAKVATVVLALVATFVPAAVGPSAGPATTTRTPAADIAAQASSEAAPASLVAIDVSTPIESLVAAASATSAPASPPPAAAYDSSSAAPTQPASVETGPAAALEPFEQAPMEKTVAAPAADTAADTSMHSLPVKESSPLAATTEVTSTIDATVDELLAGSATLVTEAVDALVTTVDGVLGPVVPALSAPVNAVATVLVDTVEDTAGLVSDVAHVATSTVDEVVEVASAPLTPLLDTDGVRPSQQPTADTTADTSQVSAGIADVEETAGGLVGGLVGGLGLGK